MLTLLRPARLSRTARAVAAADYSSSSSSRNFLSQQPHGSAAFVPQFRPDDHDEAEAEHHQGERREGRRSASWRNSSLHDPGLVDLAQLHDQEPRDVSDDPVPTNVLRKSRRDSRHSSSLHDPELQDTEHISPEPGRGRSLRHGGAHTRQRRDSWAVFDDSDDDQADSRAEDRTHNSRYPRLEELQNGTAAWPGMSSSAPRITRKPLPAMTLRQALARARESPGRRPLGLSLFGQFPPRNTRSLRFSPAHGLTPLPPKAHRLLFRNLGLCEACGKHAWHEPCPNWATGSTTHQFVGGRFRLRPAEATRRIQEDLCFYCGEHPSSVECPKMLQRYRVLLKNNRVIVPKAEKRRRRSLDLCEECGLHANSVPCQHLARRGILLVNGVRALTMAEHDRRLRQDLCVYCGLHPSGQPCATITASQQYRPTKKPSKQQSTETVDGAEAETGPEVEAQTEHQDPVEVSSGTTATVTAAKKQKKKNKDRVPKVAGDASADARMALPSGQIILTQQERQRRQMQGLCTYCGAHDAATPCPKNRSKGMVGHPWALQVSAASRREKDLVDLCLACGQHPAQEVCPFQRGRHVAARTGAGPGIRASAGSRWKATPGDDTATFEGVPLIQPVSAPVSDHRHETYALSTMVPHLSTATSPGLLGHRQRVATLSMLVGSSYYQHPALAKHANTRFISRAMRRAAGNTAQHRMDQAFAQLQAAAATATAAAAAAETTTVAAAAAAVVPQSDEL